jgi:hypothetical protein
MIFGIGCYFLDKQAQKIASTQQEITVLDSKPANDSPPKMQSGGDQKGTSVDPSQSGSGDGMTSNADDPGPGTIVFPANTNSTSGKIVTGSTSRSNSPTSNLSSINGGFSTDSAGSSSSSSSNRQSSNGSSGNLTSAPSQLAPKSSSPPPPPQQASAGGTPTESLSQTASDQLMLGAPANLAAYPIIKDGTAYQGTIESSDNLGQVNATRLASYPTVSPTDAGYLASTQIIELPIGSYTTNANFKEDVDYYINNMGPHLQRKLQTTEWTFIPDPVESYRLIGNATKGYDIIRGILTVRYNNENNILHLAPNVWYQGDVEIGMDKPAFFTNNPQDRIPRMILTSLVQYFRSSFLIFWFTTWLKQRKFALLAW